MLLKTERNDIATFGRKLISAGLTTGTGGNLSLFNRPENLIAISPSGIEYCDMQPEDIVILDLAGKVVEGRLKPSSELDFHLALYKRRPDIHAVVHTHSIYATTIACLNREIPAVHYLVGFAGKKVPVAPYATFGTPELAANITRTIGIYNAVLLANHGLVAVGPTMAGAFSIAEQVEFVARIYYQAGCIGNPVILPDKEMETVIRKFGTHGQ
ncbi:MAG: L-fuculose-phosphate aldolase [Deltaproteobacteria bacterium]|nr:L-fuculose-phosphate aldolase [Deltaproteobacteria bacterium]